MNTNTLKAIEYGVKLIGTPYDYWRGGENQKEAPMFAEDGQVENCWEKTTIL